VLWVTAAALAMVAIDLGRRILATNDEARFAMLAQDMITRGIRMFPQLNGTEYNTKPPLLAWLISLASWPGGAVTQLTAVLPSAMAAVATVLVVYGLGRAMFGELAGRFAALAVLTTQGWFLHARLPMPDMLLTLFLTIAAAALWQMEQGRAAPWWLGFYGAMAAAFWTKAAASLLALAIALAWALASGRPDRWRVLRLPSGLAVFAALIAPWVIGKLVFDTGDMREVVVSDNLLWYLPRSIAILAGPPQHLFGILFPWVLVLPVAVWHAARAIREGRSGRDALAFLIVWATALAACLGVSEQQRLRYYLPVIAPGALLVGWWIASVAEHRRATGGVPWRLYGVLGLVLGAATAAAMVVRPTWANRTHVALPESPAEIAVMTAAVIVMLGGVAVGVRRRRVQQAFAIAWIGSAVWVAGWYHWDLVRRNAAYDYPRVQSEARRLLPEAPVVAAWGVYELPFSFYFGRQVSAVRTAGDLRRVMAEHPRASAVLTRSALDQVEDPGSLEVRPLQRLNFDSIVLVSYPPDRPRAATQP
jgi:4-amino-4-deoxy-L-arabinose transferase-like glycosyltransferase